MLILSSPNYVESQEIGKHGMMPIKNCVVVDLSAKIGHSIMLSLLEKKRQWRISTDNPKMRMRIISNVHRIVIKANGATRIMIVAESTNNIIQEDDDYSSVFQALQDLDAS